MHSLKMNFGKKKNKISLIHMKKPFKSGLGGMVTSPLFSENVAILVDETRNNELCYNFACLAAAENGALPRILMSKEMGREGS